MAIPAINWTKHKADLKSGFDNNGSDAVVKPFDGKPQFTVKVIRGHKRDENLTDGIQQEGFKLKVLADDWDAKCSREPVKGDQLTIFGTRYAIQFVYLLAVGNTKLMYTMTTRG